VSDCSWQIGCGMTSNHRTASSVECLSQLVKYFLLWNYCFKLKHCTAALPSGAILHRPQALLRHFPELATIGGGFDSSHTRCCIAPFVPLFCSCSPFSFVLTMRGMMVESCLHVHAHACEGRVILM